MIIHETLKNIITDMHGLHHAIQSRSPLSCPNNLSVSKNSTTLNNGPLKRCMSSAASTSLTLMSVNPQICFILIEILNIKQNLKRLQKSASTHIHASQHVALLEQKRLMSVGLITKNKQFRCKSWTSKDRKPHSSLVSHNEYRNPPSPEDLHTFPYVVFASQFLCMPLMGKLKAALFSPTHTLRTTRASGLFHEYYTHIINLYL